MIGVYTRQTQPNRKTNGRTLSPLCRFPVLSAEDERRLFAELQAARLRLSGLERATLKSRNPVVKALAAVQTIRNHIVTANLRLLVSVARQFKTAELSIDDLVSAGMLPLIRAVELFDPSRGFRFSTYATHAVRNHLLRVRRRRASRNSRELQTPEATTETATDCEDCESRLELAEELTTLQAAVEQLSERDRMMVSARFGLGGFGKPSTFREMAELTGLSRERVRVLTNRALQRLRETMQTSAA